MDRVNVYTYPTDDDSYTTDDTRSILVGWFDADTATVFGEDTYFDGNNHISRATGSQWDHQALYRTKGGRYVLHSWSQWQGSVPTWQFLTDDQARDWLLANEHDDAVAEHFGPIEEERGPGRPEVGPAINVRLPVDLLTRVDTYAGAQDLTRAAAIRTLLETRLNNVTD